VLADKSVDAALIAGAGRLLIMDDEEIVRAVLSEMLTHLGYEAACSSNGSEAIEMYASAAESGSPFDAVIMDLTIPGGMGGKEAVKRLREVYPQAKVIVSSGYSNDPVMAEYRDYGFCGVVLKPYQVAELSGVLKEVLAKSHNSGWRQICQPV
jgi:CheY-like chemotaxis protein